ncbi:MAG: exodeoxyribonuclease VII small subunit [Motiliproteus sp.]
MRAVVPFSEERINPRVRKRGEALSRLEGIFRKVEKGEVTIEEAVNESKALLGESEDVPDFYSDLEKSLIGIPSHPSENQLEFDISTEEGFPIQGKPPLKYPKTPRQPQVPVDHFRVVVWRDSRSDRVNVKISKA